MRTWEDAALELEAIRRREIREADNLEALGVLEEAFNHELRTLPPVGWFGLQHTGGKTAGATNCSHP